MDTELARTFLTVVDAGNFVGAAERLHVSQSTVSTRINTLEDQLRCRLFIRNKAGTTLTPAGRQFQRHAATLVRTVAQAHHDIGLPVGSAGTLAVGGRIGLWEEFLLDWLPLMRRRHPAVSIRAESALEGELMHGLIEGRLDIGVMYTPQSRPGLKVEQLFEDRLVMVSTSADAAPEPQGGYVYVDWGPEFYARHSACFPDFGGPLLSANIGWLGLQHVLAQGGCGYFPARIVRAHIAAGALHLIRGAPEFFMPAYVVFHDTRHGEVVGEALSIMRDVAEAEQQTRLAPAGRERQPPEALAR
jgi:DNA-binding transcriptional LysR family regulator